jgi:hypothetical protein
MHEYVPCVVVALFESQCTHQSKPQYSRSAPTKVSHSLKGCLFSSLHTTTDPHALHVTHVTVQALAIVFVASLFEFTYAAKDCIANGSCADERAFAVSVGVISFIFCLFQLMFVRLGAPAGESHECCEVRRSMPRSALQWRESIPVCACVSWGGGSPPCEDGRH